MLASHTLVPTPTAANGRPNRARQPEEPEAVRLTFAMVSVRSLSHGYSILQRSAQGDPADTGTVRYDHGLRLGVDRFDLKLS